MLSLKHLHVALAVMMTSCELIPLCEYPGYEYKCAAEDGTTETAGDTETDSSGPETATETMASVGSETDTETSTETGTCEGAGCPCTLVEDCSPGFDCIND